MIMSYPAPARGGSMRIESDIGTYDTLGPYSGPSPERTQDRGQYQDGDRSLADLWRDRPYADLEQPSPDADPNRDALPTKKLPKLRFDDVAVKAAMIIVAQEVAEAEQAEQAAEKEKLDKLRWDDAAYLEPSWKKAAPFVDAVLGLMQGCEDFGDLESKLDQAGAPNAKLAKVIAQVAEKYHGFGYREKPKLWSSLQELVPAVGGLLKDPNERMLLKHTLESVAGVVKDFNYRGLDSPSDMGFKRLELSGKDSGGAMGDPVSLYEEAPPGKLPELESRNLERILQLLSGDEGLTKKIADGLGNWGIIDYKTGDIDAGRLQSAMRYAIEKPSATDAVLSVIGAMVKEAVRQGAGDIGRVFEVATEGNVKLAVSPRQLVQDLASGTKGLLETWLSMAVSTLVLAGKLPNVKREKDETSHTVIRNRIATNAAKIAIAVAERMLQAKFSANRDRIRQEVKIIQSIQRNAQEALSKVDAEFRARAMTALEPIINGLRNAVSENDDEALREMSNRVFEVVKTFVSEEKTVPLRASIESLMELLAKPARSASTPVADIAKRIVAPAVSRVVTKEVAEDGIDVGDDKELKLPSRYYAVSQALGAQ